MPKSSKESKKVAVGKRVQLKAKRALDGTVEWTVGKAQWSVEPFSRPKAPCYATYVCDARRTGSSSGRFMHVRSAPAHGCLSVRRS